MSKKKSRDDEVKKNLVSRLVDVASHFGVSVRTVEGWRRRVRPMPGKQGAFDLDVIANWIVMERLDKQGSGSEGGEKPSQEKFAQVQFALESAKARKEAALADQHEIKAKLIDPSFVSALEVNQFLSEFFVELRRNAVAIPIDMCAAYPASYRKAVQKDLSNRVELFLNQMGDWVRKFNDDHEVVSVEHVDTSGRNDSDNPAG